MHGQPPNIIHSYDPAWSILFNTEKQVLAPILARWLAGPIEHIGSTAIPGLPAKPVIDIMAAVTYLATSKSAINALLPLNYSYFDYKAEEMHWFYKPSDFNRTHHLHLIPFKSKIWFEILAFRDYLRDNETARLTYAELKFRLAIESRGDREAYTNAKTEFIQSILSRIL